jgi:hypothetical protein
MEAFAGNSPGRIARGLGRDGTALEFAGDVFVAVFPGSRLLHARPRALRSCLQASQRVERRPKRCQRKLTSLDGVFQRLEIANPSRYSEIAGGIITIFPDLIEFESFLC